MMLICETLMWVITKKITHRLLKYRAAVDTFGTSSQIVTEALTISDPAHPSDCPVRVLTRTWWWWLLSGPDPRLNRLPSSIVFNVFFYPTFFPTYAQFVMPTLGFTVKHLLMHLCWELSLCVSPTTLRNNKVLALYFTNVRTKPWRHLH